MVALFLAVAIVALLVVRPTTGAPQTRKLPWR
jgi:hypothetical protein